MTTVLAALEPGAPVLHPSVRFGIRGLGEVGTIPPAAAVANAVRDAPADVGVELDTPPITPEAVWRDLSGRATGHGFDEELAPTPEDLPDGGVGY
jgi:aerobic carbon-monoxide dehydrogenase large subunit